MLNFGDLKDATKKAAVGAFEEMLQKKFMHQSLCDGFEGTVKISSYDLARLMAEREDLSRNVNMCKKFKETLVSWLKEEGYNAEVYENSIIVKL